MTWESWRSNELFNGGSGCRRDWLLRTWVVLFGISAVWLQDVLNTTMVLFVWPVCYKLAHAHWLCCSFRDDGRHSTGSHGVPTNN